MKLSIFLFHVSRYSEEGTHESKTFLAQNLFGDKPRSTYALVAVHVRTDEEYQDQDPAAIITLIHLPDLFCNAPATILTQYLKCKDDRVLNLKVCVRKSRCVINLIN